MLKRKILQIAVSGALLTSLVASPFAINMDRLTSYAKNDSKVYEQPIDSLTFISSTDVESKIKKIKENKAENFGRMQAKLKKNALKVSSVKLTGKLNKKDKKLKESTDIAVNVDDVRGNADLQQYLHNALGEGKRVYLYGALDIQEYKQLLGIDEIKAKHVADDGKVNDVSFGLSKEDLAKLEKEKGPMKPNAPKADESSNIIGYSLNENEERQFVDISTGSVDDHGNTSRNTEDVYVAQIMSQQADLVELEEEAEKTEETALISTNVASAELKRQKNGWDIYSEIWNSSYTVRYGRVDMQWQLWQEMNDGNKEYDAFQLRPTTQALADNGARAWYLWQDIDIPSDSDHLETWTPKGDSAKASLTLSMSFPWSFSGSMTFADAITIDDQSSIGYDYGRWDLRDDNLSGEAFQGSIGWYSHGTWAYVTYAGKVGVRFGPSYQYVAYTPNKRVTVSWDY